MVTLLDDNKWPWLHLKVCGYHGVSGVHALQLVVMVYLPANVSVTLQHQVEILVRVVQMNCERAWYRSVQVSMTIYLRLLSQADCFNQMREDCGCV